MALEVSIDELIGTDKDGNTIIDIWNLTKTAYALCQQNISDWER